MCLVCVCVGGVDVCVLCVCVLCCVCCVSVCVCVCVCVCVHACVKCSRQAKQALSFKLATHVGNFLRHLGLDFENVYMT